jgi:hypothetical protein
MRACLLIKMKTVKTNLFISSISYQFTCDLVIMQPGSWE